MHFHPFRILKLTIFDTKIGIKIFEEYIPAGFRLMTNRFVVNALTQCNTLFGKNIGKENDEIMSDLLFISIGSKSQYGGAHL